MHILISLIPIQTFDGVFTNSNNTLTDCYVISSLCFCASGTPMS